MSDMAVNLTWVFVDLWRNSLWDFLSIRDANPDLDYPLTHDIIHVSQSLYPFIDIAFARKHQPEMGFDDILTYNPAASITVLLSSLEPLIQAVDLADASPLRKGYERTTEFSKTCDIYKWASVLVYTVKQQLEGVA